MRPSSISVASCLVVLAVAGALPTTASTNFIGSGTTAHAAPMPSIAPPPAPPPQRTPPPAQNKTPPPIPKRPPPVDNPAHGPNPLG